MAKLFDLRPDKSLLDPTFEGYKLSLETLPVYRHELPAPVEHLKPSEDQFSYQHVKSFGFHNHLVGDLWDSEFAYFVAGNRQVYRVGLHSLTSQSPEFSSVWQIPSKRESYKGCFNPSLSFASQHLAVVADGGGCLFVLDTSSRSSANPQPWQILLSPKVSEEEKPFFVIDTHYEEVDSTLPTHLHVLLQRVEQTAQVESQIPLSTLACDEKETPFVTLLEHLTYTCKDGHWEMEQLKRLAVPHGLDYAAILPPGKSLCVAAREPLGIIHDSLKSVAVPPAEDQLAKSDKNEPHYVWSETSDEINVWLSLGKEASKEDVGVDKSTDHLRVRYKDQVKLDGQLSRGVNVESSLWTLSDGKLEIILSKLEKDVVWNELIRNDQTKGLKVTDPESAAEWHQRLIHLTSEEAVVAQSAVQKSNVFSDDQLEECDAFPSEETYLMRFDGPTNQMSHKASLGSHLVLFSTQLAPSMAPALCLRHDVDGLVWQPMGDELDKSWTCLHLATFQALGYVQASKEQRKFTVCPPNFSYAACCDARRHVYIYRQPASGCSSVQLVHRPTGRRLGSVARQQVLSLDTTEEFLGSLATDSLLLILTSSALFAVRTNND